MGRPTKFDAKFVRVAEKMCALGATDAELAEAFDVDVRTILRWRAEKPEFCRALKTGKAVSDDRVERSLFQRAVGYEIESEKVFCNASGEVTRAKIVEHTPPDVTACIFWLKNRRKEEWRDKTETGFTDPDGKPISPVLHVAVARNQS